MGSPCELLCESDSIDEVARIAEAVADEAWRIEDKYSRYVPGNIIDRINTANGEPVDVDEETARLINFSVTLFELSEGRFDITSGVLRRAWTFDGSDRVPTREAVDAALRHVGWQRVDWSGSRLAIPRNMEIDLGGVGKEYAVDRATKLVSELSDASCLVNFGGDLAVTRPPGRRPAWQVGIDAPGDDAIVIGLSAGALATSGDARRFLLKDGVRFGHILDPTTGWPVQKAPGSITVAADTCVQAGMLCTLAMLQGETAKAFLDAQNVDYWIAG
jgi:thiamine biosynthesis lipoprotein